MEKDLVFILVFVLMAVLFNLPKENFLYGIFREIGKKFQNFHLSKRLNKK